MSVTDSIGGEHERLAPVIPLFGADRSSKARGDEPAAPAEESPGEPSSATWHRSWIGDGPVSVPTADNEMSDADAVADAVAAAEKQLLRRLRSSSLSISEARKALAAHDLAADTVETIIQLFTSRGYLDDAALAEQLVHVGVDRKGHGRQMIARTLSSRGIPRDVIDAALSAMPDDEARRALEFARSRASRLQGLDESTAMRRLLGQLMRRGYGGPAASDAARQALLEGRRGSSGVRFE